MNAKELMPLLRLHGRTVLDEEKNALFFNWTCAGFTVRFRGKTLRAHLTALGDKIPPFPGMPELPPDYPWMGVVADGADTPTNCKIYDQADEWATLFEGEDGEHSVRVVKLSENARGKLGLLARETDGEFLPALAEKKPRIEIVGDSITCGFGNCSENTFEFRSDEENGWMSYGALAARELGCDWSMICESGIACSQPEKPMFVHHGMDEIYAYTDEMYDRRRGVEPVKWDFAANRNDAVVLNLGTNDSNPIRFYRDIDEVPAMEAHYERKYGEFVRAVRALNGPDTLIACTLGTMDYYLWDRLRDAVEAYKRETGDEKVILFKFIAINIMTEGYGAAGHPSLKTHLRMGRELAHLLKPYLS